MRAHVQDGSTGVEDLEAGAAFASERAREPQQIN
jgi:hypothetical protein